ncbi:hypothetical protein ACLKMH_03435 [Psychromonas sp. KJ10-10]|uniref:hypothetical protein n=1 Tax=Psychromonas sp. KJ10-10 TaxID=3391823 RepID=UPI0039B6C32D
MLTVFVADIFGKTKALQQLASQLVEQPEDILLIDPYQGEIIEFESEQQAYQYFNKQIGLPDYAQHLTHCLNKIKQPFNLIAFSVGGSAVWLNATNLINTQVNKVVCFYASQIRHHLTIIPSVPIDLILPRYELHFDIIDLAIDLNNHKQVTLTPCEFLHGFMNQLSKNYDPKGYYHFQQKLKADINGE